MRAHNSEHRDSLPILDVTALRHIAYVLDAIIFYIRATSDMEMDHRSDPNNMWADDQDENDNEELDDDLTSSIVMDTDSMDESDLRPSLGRRHGFFTRSESTLCLGCPPPDPFNTPMTEALPLADQPHLLHPNARREELFKMSKQPITLPQTPGTVSSDQLEMPPLKLGLCSRNSRTGIQPDNAAEPSTSSAAASVVVTATPTTLTETTDHVAAAQTIGRLQHTTIVSIPATSEVQQTKTILVNMKPDIVATITTTPATPNVVKDEKEKALRSPSPKPTSSSKDQTVSHHHYKKRHHYAKSHKFTVSPTSTPTTTTTATVTPATPTTPAAPSDEFEERLPHMEDEPQDLSHTSTIATASTKIHKLDTYDDDDDNEEDDDDDVHHVIKKQKLNIEPPIQQELASISSASGLTISPSTSAAPSSLSSVRPPIIVTSIKVAEAIEFAKSKKPPSSSTTMAECVPIEIPLTYIPSSIYEQDNNNSGGGDQQPQRDSGESQSAYPITETGGGATIMATGSFGAGGSSSNNSNSSGSSPSKGVIVRVGPSVSRFNKTYVQKLMELVPR
jgi:hypothetical protein